MTIQAVISCNIVMPKSCVDHWSWMFELEYSNYIGVCVIYNVSNSSLGLWSLKYISTYSIPNFSARREAQFELLPRQKVKQWITPNLASIVTEELQHNIFHKLRVCQENFWDSTKFYTNKRQSRGYSINFI